MTETLAYGYSSESTQRDLSNEYQQLTEFRWFSRNCIHVLWTKVASALEGLNLSILNPSSRDISKLYLNVDTVNPFNAETTFV